MIDNLSLRNSAKLAFYIRLTMTERDSVPTPITDNKLGLGLEPGATHYRAFVGPPQDYDLVAAMCFGLLTALGLRGRHRLLDVGCGSLRLGRLLIPYLNEGNYFGMEPNQWLVEDGLAQELGPGILPIKQPHFAYTDSVAQMGHAGEFDFAIAQSIFSHCGSDLLHQHLSDIHAALSPTGALVATFVQGDASTDAQGWVYPGCVDYTASDMAQVATACDFEFALLDWLHPRQRWALFAKPGFDTRWLLGHPLGWNTWLAHGPK
jgi:SAM-dependent methyltransferase